MVRYTAENLGMGIRGVLHVNPSLADGIRHGTIDDEPPHRWFRVWSGAHGTPYARCFRVLQTTA